VNHQNNIKIIKGGGYLIKNCPYCGSIDLSPYGHSTYKGEYKKRYFCNDCGKFPKEKANDIKQNIRYCIEKEKRLYEPLQLTRKKSMIICDVHIPLHDKKLFNTMLNVSQEKKINTCIIDGDLLNVDAFSYFEQRVPEEEEARNFTFERTETMKALHILEDNFKEIIINMGNHEIYRLMAIFKGKLNLRDIFRLFTDNIDKYQITNRDHIVLTSGNKKWRICHPKNYSQIKGRIPYRLAGKYEMNIISAHGHFCDMSISESGKYVVINSGGLFDSNKVAYIQTTNTYPLWNQGFLTIENGYPDLYNPLFRDLSKYVDNMGA